MASGNSLFNLWPLQAEPPSSNSALLEFINNQWMLKFDASTAWSAVFPIIMPRAYAGGGITCNICWAPDTSTTITQKVCWTIAIERVQDETSDFDSDSFATGVTDATGSAVPGGSARVAQYVAIALTDGAQMDSLVAGETGRLKITRSVAEANDDMSGFALLRSIEIRET